MSGWHGGNHCSVDLDPNDGGWFLARCECGWEAGGAFPSAEDACDALMDHAFEAGRAAPAAAAPEEEDAR